MPIRLPNAPPLDRPIQENFDAIAQRFPVRTDDIDADAITAAKIATDAVGAAEIAAGAVGDSEIADAYIVSGQYQPTLTNTANLDGSTSNANTTYMRVGNIVTVAGSLNIDATTTATLTTLGISLPIASNLAAAGDLGGTASNQQSNIQEAFGITGDTGNDRATMQGSAVSVADHRLGFIFQYVIL